MMFPKKFIEKNLYDMIDSHKRVRYGDMVYWANATTREIYALSADAYDNGVIDGYKVGNISDDYTTVTKAE